VASGPFGLAPTTNSIAPMTNSVAPMVMPSFAPVYGNSLALDDDMDMMAMRPKRRLGKILAGVAVLSLAGVAFAVVQSGGLRLPKLKVDDSVAQASAASLSVSSLKQAEPSQPQAAATPAPEAAKPEAPKAEEAKPADAAPSTEAKKGDDRFSEEMKAALLNKDKDKKAASSKKQAKKAGRAVAARGAGKAKGSGGGFKTGGSAYDPLNGKL
jgi:outer membrane biosynthesis protein TonB